MRVTSVGLGAVAVLGAAGLGYLAGARSHAPANVGEEDKSAVVARVGPRELRAAALKARFDEFGPMARTRLATVEGKREVLDELIRTELLAEAARQQGYARDPRVERRLDEALADVFLERELEPKRVAVSIGDTEIRARYEVEKERLSSPERVRIAQVFLSAPTEPAVARAQRRQAALEVLAQAQRALKKDFNGFAPLASEKSEDPETRPHGGELPPMTRAELASRTSEQVAAAAFEAQRPGVLIGTVLESPAGFHVVRVLERQRATSPSFEQVRETLRTRLKQEKQQQLSDELFAGLRTRIPVEVDADALKEVQP